MNPTPSAVLARSFADLLEDPDRIGPRDVRHFRREVFRDGVVSHREAEAIFTLDGAVAAKCPQWAEFFVEALTDFIVNQAEPRGYVSFGNAEWLIDRISHDGHLDSVTELELLVKVLDRAKSSPDILIRFTLNEIARAALEGEGPLVGGRQLKKGVLGEPEVELIRRILFAVGGEAGISISRAEAETLFDLNDRTIHEENHPAWSDLFVKAVGNYLLAAASYRAPPRAVALAREEWLEDRSVDIRDTVRGVFAGFGESFTKSFFEDVVDAHEQIERAWAQRNRAAQAAEARSVVLSADEADWLIDRLSNDGVVHENEKALLRFIREESPDIHPRLNPWLDKIA